MDIIYKGSEENENQGDKKIIRRKRNRLLMLASAILPLATLGNPGTRLESDCKEGDSNDSTKSLENYSKSNLLMLDDFTKRYNLSELEKSKDNQILPKSYKPKR